MGQYYESTSRLLSEYGDDLTGLTEATLTESEKQVLLEQLKHLAFDLSLYFTLGIVTQISESLGSEKLVRTLERIRDLEPRLSFAMLDTAVLLNCPLGFPQTRVQNLYKALAGNPFGISLLRYLVVIRIYYSPAGDFDFEKRICETLGINYMRILTERTRSLTSPPRTSPR